LQSGVDSGARDRGENKRTGGKRPFTVTAVLARTEMGQVPGTRLRKKETRCQRRGNETVGGHNHEEGKERAPWSTNTKKRPGRHDWHLGQRNEGRINMCKNRKKILKRKKADKLSNA